MSQTHWKPIVSAPMNGKQVLLYGATEADNPCGVRYREPIVFAGYFSKIDDAWCAVGSQYDGPFFEPTHWAHLPEPPQL